VEEHGVHQPEHDAGPLTAYRRLHTPLATIKALVGALLAETEQLTLAEQRSALYRLDAAADQLMQTADGLLYLARLSAPSARPSPARVDLVAVATRAVGEARRRHPERAIALIVGEGDASVHGDAERLVQVVANLLDNAVRYAPYRGDVAVAVEAGMTSVRLSVTDHGIGIAPEHQRRIFEPFYRIPAPDCMARDTGGSGLGLSICREIVERHGGTITVESAPGAGATFTVWLPVAHAASAAG
jgi:two-component system OmpR family sensor kinase